MLSKDVVAVRDFRPNEFESGFITEGTYGETRGKMRNGKYKIKFFSGGVIVVCTEGKDFRFLDDIVHNNHEDEEDLDGEIQR